MVFLSYPDVNAAPKKSLGRDGKIDFPYTLIQEFTLDTHPTRPPWLIATPAFHDETCRPSSYRVASVDAEVGAGNVLGRIR